MKISRRARALCGDAVDDDDADPISNRLGLRSDDLPYRAKVPAVDFGARDLQDSAERVTAATIERDYQLGRKARKVRVYASYLPVERLPTPRGTGIEAGEPAVEMTDEDDSGGYYEWQDFSVGHRAFPPVKIRRLKSGELVIMDGNHRTAWWTQHGYTFIPAWVIDEVLR